MNLFRLLTILFFILLGCMAASAQEMPEDERAAGIKAFREVRALRALVEAQKLENSVIIALNDALEGENKALRAETVALREQGKEKTDVIESQKAQIRALSELKCDTTSLFWGLIKKKSCK